MAQQPLTLDELNKMNPEKTYNVPAPGYNPKAWDSISLPITLPKPIKLTFDDNIRKSMGTNVKYKKGIYMFCIEPDFPFQPEVRYIMYIGRVIKKNTFFKRFYDYVKAIGDANKRRNIQLLTNLWNGKMFVYYYDLSQYSDDIISNIETQLIGRIIPPMNNELYLKEAQNTRSLYN